MWNYACHPSFWETRQEGHEFEASLDFLVRLCLKKKKGEVDEALKEHPFLYPWTFTPLAHAPV